MTPVTEDWLTQAAAPEIEAPRAASNHALSIDQVIDLVQSRVGKNLVDQIRDLLGEFIDCEYELLEQRQIAMGGAEPSAEAPSR